ncbi:MAG: hypothetical protein K1X66_02465, partial [Verrucomicrobiae bacterium]|nr:hypothetical protein [Verrucomicrobiae bacterium]
PKPKENPQETHGLPTANPGETDKIGYDKEDKEDKINPPYPLKADDVPIPKELDDPVFKDSWKDWLEFRKSKRKPVSIKAAQAQLNDFVQWGKTAAIESIKHSIKSDYQGLFQPGSRNGNQRRKAATAEEHANGW